MTRALVFLLVLTGCASVKSTDVATSSIYAQFTAVTEGSGTTATAVLRVGEADSNTYVNLEAGDTLTAAADAGTDGEELVELAEVNLGDLYGYVGLLTADAEGTPFTFAFTRDAAESAPDSHATMPAPFALTSPVADTAVSRAEDITVTWEPSGGDDPVQVTLSGDCILDVTEDVAGDPGTYTFEPGSYVVPDGQEGESCAGTLTVRRLSYGELDPALSSGGVVYAAQERSVDVRLDP